MRGPKEIKVLRRRESIDFAEGIRAIIITKKYVGSVNIYTLGIDVRTHVTLN